MNDSKVKARESNSPIASDRRLIRILLVDDGQIVLEILRMSLSPEPDLEIVGTAADGQTAIEQVKALQPDIAIIDVEMPGMDGIAATEIICQQCSKTKVLILSSHDDIEYVKKALKVGAKGYLLKSTPHEEFVHAIRFIQKGYLQLEPGLFEKLGLVNNSIAPSQISAIALDKPSRTLPLADEKNWSHSTQELIDTLPRIWTRGLLYFLAIFIAIALPWAMLSKVEQTGSARGRIEPKGKTLKLDAPVAGTVVAVKVKEGQTVKAKQVLLELESEIPDSELQQNQAKLEGQLNRVSQLITVKNQLEIAVRTQRLQSQAQESEQLAQLDQIQQRLSSNQKVLALEKDRLKLAQNEVRRHRYLWQKGAISRSKFEEIESNSFERQRLLEQVQSELQQDKTELEKQRRAYDRVRRTGELSVLDSLRQLKELQSQDAIARSEIAQSQKLIQSLRFQLQQRVVRAPTNGTIFQLSIQNAGAVLQPGQEIASISPQGAILVFRAQMPSSESGFLRVGMPVKLKFDAYPFEDYGVVLGQVRWVSPDSKVVETAAGKAEVFELEIALEKTYIQTQNKQIVLTPGQTGTAEVIVRQRRLIDFILDPFKKLQKGGLEL